jgi:hypothetical protein
MATGALAALLSLVILGFVEVFGRSYPVFETWARLRRERGRRATRLIRERLEATSAARGPRLLGYALVVAALAWIAAASLLDKRWYEVVVDILPQLLVAAALLRVPHASRAAAERMRSYEKRMGEDPDRETDDEEPQGPDEIVL